MLLTCFPQLAQDIIKEIPARGTRRIIGFPGPLNFKGKILEQLTRSKVTMYTHLINFVHLKKTFARVESKSLLSDFSKNFREEVKKIATIFQVFDCNR